MESKKGSQVKYNQYIVGRKNVFFKELGTGGDISKKPSIKRQILRA